VPKCPISCGDCCDQWAYIEVLWHGNHHLNREDPCPNLGPDGCILPRSKRPKACRDYMCSRAKQLVQELKRISKARRSKHQEAPDSISDVTT
jgi:hypothetical protein